MYKCCKPHSSSNVDCINVLQMCYKCFILCIKIKIIIIAKQILNNNRMMQILYNNIGSDANIKPPTEAAASRYGGGFVFIFII